MRVVGLDLGGRRIGVAVSDATGTLATPHSVVERGKDRAEDHRRLADLVEELGAEWVVVGLPLSLSGVAGPAACAADEEARALAGAVAVPVETWDERLTTVSAERSLRAGGVRARDRRRVVDKVAAAVLLQGWLDARAR
ncbi:MAG: Holliday junction resolvase RuvX [Actinomycetota bacterium]|nr:Holliday junction resolvase RuvX [Actinomycetota bacterium]